MHVCRYSWGCECECRYSWGTDSRLLQRERYGLVVEIDREPIARGDLGIRGRAPEPSVRALVDEARTLGQVTLVNIAQVGSPTCVGVRGST